MSDFCCKACGSNLENHLGHEGLCRQLCECKAALGWHVDDERSVADEIVYLRDRTRGSAELALLTKIDALRSGLNLVAVHVDDKTTKQWIANLLVWSMCETVEPNANLFRVVTASRRLLSAAKKAKSLHVLGSRMVKCEVRKRSSDALIIGDEIAEKTKELRLAIGEMEKALVIEQQA